MIEENAVGGGGVLNMHERAGKKHETFSSLVGLQPFTFLESIGKQPGVGKKIVSHNPVLYVTLRASNGSESDSGL